LKNYEVLFILKPDLEKEGLDDLYKKIQENITKYNGQVGTVEAIGKKALAYKIGNFKDGIYYLVNLKMDPGQVPTLNSDLKLDESIIRFMFTEKQEDRLQQQL